MRRFLVLLIAACWALPLAAQPFGASASEFRVNTSTTAFGDYRPDIAYHTSDSFMIVWSGYGGSDGRGVFGQRYDGTAHPLGTEFRVNTYTTSVQSYPRLGGAPQGSVSADHFVVVWNSEFQDGSGDGVFAQAFASGVPLGMEFRVNDETAGHQYDAALSLDVNGGFVVVWTQPDGSSYGIFGRRYTAAGSPLGGSFQVNTYTTGTQRYPAVARSFGGELVVVWESYREFGSSFDVVGRRLTTDGTPLGDDFRVSSATTAMNRSASVAPVGEFTSGFVVTWQEYVAFPPQISARRLDGIGTPLAAPFRVNTSTHGGGLYNPAVAGDATGAFVIVWDSTSDVWGQRFSPNGAPFGSEFHVNSTTTLEQRWPRVASPAAGGRFVVTWTWDAFHEEGDLVYARQFCPLQGDANGSDTIDVADVFYLINDLFAGGPAPIHPADVNGDGHVDVTDVFALINYLFAGGPAPVCLN